MDSRCEALIDVLFNNRVEIVKLSQSVRTVEGMSNQQDSKLLEMMSRDGFQRH